MYRMIIELNEEKIIEDDKYCVEDILSVIDTNFEESGIKKIQKGVFEDSGERLVQFLGVASWLKKQEVFVRYVKRWLWYENEDEVLHNDPENLIETFKLKVF